METKTREQRLVDSLGAAHDSLQEYRRMIYQNGGCQETQITRELDSACQMLRRLRVDLPTHDTRGAKQ